MKRNKGINNKTNLYGTKRKEARSKNFDEQRRSVYSQTLKPRKKGINGPTHGNIAPDRASGLKQTEKENSKYKAHVRGNAVVKTNKWYE